MYFIGTNEIFFQAEAIALVLKAEFNCMCQTPFSLTCPIRKAKNEFRFLFEQVSLSGVLFL